MASTCRVGERSRISWQRRTRSSTGVGPIQVPMSSHERACASSRRLSARRACRIACRQPSSGAAAEPSQKRVSAARFQARARPNSSPSRPKASTACAATAAPCSWLPPIQSCTAVRARSARHSRRSLPIARAASTVSPRMESVRESSPTSVRAVAKSVKSSKRVGSSFGSSWAARPSKLTAPGMSPRANARDPAACSRLDARPASARVSASTEPSSTR